MFKIDESNESKEIIGRYENAVEYGLKRLAQHCFNQMNKHLSFNELIDVIKIVYDEKAKHLESIKEIIYGVASEQPNRNLIVETRKKEKSSSFLHFVVEIAAIVYLFY